MAKSNKEPNKNLVKKFKQHKVKARSKGQRLTVPEKETILAYRYQGMTYNEIAKLIGCSYEAVEYTVNVWAPKSPEKVKLARAKAAEHVADLATNRAILALDAITEDSLKHDRIEHYNDAGELTSVAHSGPTGLQAATTVGILVDKTEKLRAIGHDLREGRGNTALGPGDMAALLDQIKGRVARISALQVDFDGESVLARANELGGAVEAEFTEVEDDDD